MMAGLLLVRAGVEVTVLEKHADFFRDFRGDTVHPSTMQILDEMELLDRFLQRPHNRITQAEIDWNGRVLKVGDFSHLKMPAPYIAMMPQWEFLDFLRDEAVKYPGFTLRMEAEAIALIAEGERIAGAQLADGTEIRAHQLVLMCDGRTSLARGILPLETLGAPIDVLWFAVPKNGAGETLRGSVSGNNLLVMIDRGDYWQCASVIAKGSAHAIRDADLMLFGKNCAALLRALPIWKLRCRTGN